jgi:glycosyltransferase involved in cell wall biosynthesis
MDVAARFRPVTKSATAPNAPSEVTGFKGRVVLVGPSLRYRGGQAVQMVRLRDGLQAAGVAVEQVFVDPDLPGPLRILEGVRYGRTVARLLPYLASLAQRIRQGDVVHCYSASYWSFVVAPLPAMLIARMRGAAVLLNYHSGEAEDHLRRWSWLMHRALRLAHVIVVPSDFLVGVFGRFGVPARRIPNSLDNGSASYRRRVALRPIILCSRNHEPLYRVDDVLRAFATVQGARPDARLILAGDGSQRPALEALTRDLGLNHVEFLGSVAPSAMPAIYDRADVFINASDTDNMPLSILEANAAGLPVVSTDAGGIPWLVEPEVTGLLVPVGDHAALATAVMRLLERPGLAAQLGDAAHTRFLREYSWESVREQWLECYAAGLRTMVAG